MHLLRRQGIAAPVLLPVLLIVGGVTAALSTGCGSSSSSPTAHIRGADFSVNGSTTGVLVNSTAVGGDLSYGQTSSYNYVGQGVSTFAFTSSVSFPTTTAAGATTSVVIPPNPQLQLNNGSYYSAYLIGRVDVLPITTARADPRFLQTVITGDKGAAANYQPTASGTVTAVYADPPSGQANIRVLNAAPDAGPVDVLIGGKVAFAAAAYPALPLGLTGANVPAATPATPYSPLPSGTLSVQVNAAGTSTVLVPPTSISVSGGQSYTLLVTEPTTAPTYSLSTENDG